MIEFNETLDTKFKDKSAIIQRMNTRLKHTTKDIPYYDRGIDLEEFVYGSQIAAIKLGFKDFGPNVTYNQSNDRVQYYEVSIDVSSLKE